MHANRNWNRNALFLVFALSGFAGLIYESIWSHYLKLFLGHASYAQVLVLSIFMGGMALGAWIISRYTHRIKRLFWYYALIELLLAGFAFTFHPVYLGVTSFSYDFIMPALGSPMLVHMYKWGMASLLILPQSMLLGATFPLMSNAVIRRFPGVEGFDISMLYFTNSFGAAMGVLASGFVLIAWVGLPGTVIIAGILNLVVAVLTWVLTYLFQYPEDDVHASMRAQGEPEGKRSTYRFILFAAGITGAASFMYEIGWIRLLSMVLGSSSHAFELMLSAFILGIAFGGLWIRKRIDSLKNPIRFLAVVQLVMGLLALGTVLTYGHNYNVMGFFMAALARSQQGYWLFNLSSHLIAMAVMVPVTFCAGMTLPLMTSLLLKKNFGEKSVGGVYAANTLGSIIGIAVAVQVVMPLASLKAVLVWGAALDICLAIALYLWAKDRWFFEAPSYPDGGNGRTALMTVSSVFGVLLLLWVGFSYQLDPGRMVSGVYRGGRVEIKDGSEVVYKRDGKSATVTVTKTAKDLYVIATNGKPDASIDMRPKKITLDEPTQVLMAALPLSIYASPTTAAVIGFGSGVTAHVMLDSSTIKDLDVIEIEPAMAEGAKLFAPHNDNVYNSSRSHIYYEDAKAFFSTHQKKYDLIISEPSNPWVSGVSGLFSTEFYERAKNHLTQDGMFTQWLNTYEMDMNLVISVLKAVDAQFPYYAVYSASDTDILIMAKTSAPVGVPTAHIFSNSKLRGAMSNIGVTNVNDLDLRRIATEQVLRPYLTMTTAPANSDFYPYLDLNSVKSRFLRMHVKNLNNLGFLAPLSMLESDSPRFDITRISRNHGFSRAKYAQRAVLLYEGIMHTSNYTKHKVANDVRVVVDTLSPLGAQCVTGANVASWNLAFFDAASVMANYISEKNLDEALSLIKSKSCYEGLPALSKDIVTFFEAVNKRNASGMARSGKKLLIDYPKLDKKMRAYVLSATMIGYLAHKRYQPSLEAWNEYSKQIFTGRNKTPGGTLQVLLAYTVKHIRQG